MRSPNFVRGNNRLMAVIEDTFIIVGDKMNSNIDRSITGEFSKTIWSKFRKGIDEYKKRTGGSLLVITHNTRILESLTVDKTHILSAGQIVAHGGADLVDDVIANGFDKYIGK